MIGCLPSCENKPSAPLAQSVEHLPFKQGVRGSNPRRGTKKRSTAMPQPTKAIISNEQKSGIRKGSNRASTGKVGALLLSVYIV